MEKTAILHLYYKITYFLQNVYKMLVEWKPDPWYTEPNMHKTGFYQDTSCADYCGLSEAASRKPG